MMRWYRPDTAPLGEYWVGKGKHRRRVTYQELQDLQAINRQVRLAIASLVSVGFLLKPVINSLGISPNLRYSIHMVIHQSVGYLGRARKTNYLSKAHKNNNLDLAICRIAELDPLVNILEASWTSQNTAIDRELAEVHFQLKQLSQQTLPDIRRALAP